MTGTDWSDRNARALALYLDGSDDPDRAADGTPLLDDDFLVLVNAWWEPLAFTIPATRTPATGPPGPAAGVPTWQAGIDTYNPTRPTAAASLRAGDQLTVSPRSIFVLRGPADGGPV